MINKKKTCLIKRFYINDFNDCQQLIITKKEDMCDKKISY